ncbi:hypothetical protein TNCV_5000761 [Trichonephila clavipes]|nr:hypothetical protein TNCV_5000761 [Trichonephila clavipes]
MEGVLEGKERERLSTDQEFEEQRQIREYELEQLRLSNATDTVSVSFADLEGLGAAVKANSHPREPYLLGNGTADLIESSEKSVHTINAIETLSAILPTQGDGNESTIEIPAFEGKKAWLVQITSSDFSLEQKCPDLRALWEKAKLGVDGEFRMVEGKLNRFPKDDSIGSRDLIYEQIDTLFLTNSGYVHSSVSHPQSNAVEEVQ